MPHLALNTLLPPLMKVRYQVAIGAAPIGLMFASFGLVFWLPSWLETVSGIPPNSPINAQAHCSLTSTLSHTSKAIRHCYFS